MINYIKRWWVVHKEQVVRRVKSFLWRSLVAFLIGLVAWIIGLVKDLGAPEMVVMLVVMVGGEITKALNNNTNLFGTKIK